MDKKKFVYLILSIGLIGVTIALVYAGAMGFINIFPSDSEIGITKLVADCGKTAQTYSLMPSEANRKNFCCSSVDLNENGIINSDEYCARAYMKDISGQSPARLCRQPIDYYTTYNLCD